MRTPIPIFAVFTALFTSQALAAEDGDAQALYEQNCISCHGSEVFTREDHKIRSLPALDAQVRSCEAAQGLGWSDDEISGVARLLNDRFYHFAPGS
jgi:mono/diheme cytochrome c family protein